jgi:predicted xylose isomerase-like sugar epimerase
VEFRAQIQYVIYRIPGRDIAAVVDGTARTRISAVQVKSKESRQQVEDDVAAAAVESAARRAPAALLAVSQK